jgi:hypothetical protein
MKQARRRQSNTPTPLSLQIMRWCCVLCALTVVVYFYLAFSTTALVAQHRALGAELDMLAAERSSSEYAFHALSETLFQQGDIASSLSTPDTIAFISLSTTTNVAFAQTP